MVDVRVGVLSVPQPVPWDPIVEAKILPPPLPGWFVERPRLTDRLEAGDDDVRRLTLVSAPPGYGKTAAVRAWIAATGRRVAWLTLEQDDNDPVRFARYLAASLRKGRPSSDAEAPESGSRAALDAWLSAVVRAIGADDDPLCVVLDDYHLVTAASVHALTANLIAHVPPFVRLVIVTRHDPPLAIGRLRAQGALLELRAEDLRCTAPEARDVLTVGLSLDLADAAVDSLYGLTEGWMAALQLAGLTARGRSDPGAAARGFGGAHPYVIDYLTEEILERQDEAMRSFLVSTAIADRFTPELCDELTGGVDSGSMLRRIERENLFLLRLDGRGEWFRYHHLFADALRSLLPEPEQARLHEVAARWFDARGHGHEAVRHALASGNARVSAELVARTAPAALESGEAETVLEWLEALPAQPSLIAADLEVYRAWACWSTYQTSAAEAAASAMEEGDLDAAARGRLLCLRALLDDLHRRPSGEANALRALELLDRPDYFRFMALAALGSIRWGSETLAAGAASLEQAVELARRTRRRVPARYGAYLLAGALDVLGRRREAERLCRELAAEDLAGGLPPSPYLDAGLGLAVYEAGGDAEGFELLERALRLSRRTGFAFTGRALLALCQLRFEYEGADAALAAIRTVRSTIDDPASLDAFPQLDAFETVVRLQDGDLAAAQTWAAATNAKVDARWSSPILRMFRDSTLARILIAQRHDAEASTLLTETRRLALRCGSVLDQITLALLRSEVAERAGDRAAACRHVGDAVVLAARDGYVRRFVEDGRRVGHLLPTVRAAAPEFVDRVMGALERTAAAPKLRPSGLWRGPDGALLELLTGRELEVLRHVAAGGSNAAIADALGVSVGTIKWHVVNLLGKLQASSRTQAIARARELGLL